MKFGALIELKTLYRMTPRSSSSAIAFKVKLKFTLFDLEFDLENNAFHVAYIYKSAYIEDIGLYLHAKCNACITK